MLDKFVKLRGSVDKQFTVARKPNEKKTLTGIRMFRLVQSYRQVKLILRGQHAPSKKMASMELCFLIELYPIFFCQKGLLIFLKSLDNSVETNTTFSQST